MKGRLFQDSASCSGHLEQMPNNGHETPFDSTAAWVTALFEELHDPQVLEVVLRPDVYAATVECRGAAGPLRQLRIPSLIVASVFAKMKKLARLDVAERSQVQCGRVRLLNFHGSPADFVVTTGSAGKSETMTLRRL